MRPAHPTFYEPNRSITNRRTSFELRTSAWGCSTSRRMCTSQGGRRRCGSSGTSTSDPGGRGRPELSVGVSTVSSVTN
ncbi:pYEATS domain-containing protein [Amycolatopsis sp.]|uniref:pYEATS domain-containing protein n=1 Tax=Amycolatopsis sp. TaxID=37632 RepID=UPI0039C8B38E